MQSNNRKQIIMGCIYKYNFEQFKPFLITLNESGYKGDLCLFVSEICKNTYRRLRQYPIKLIPFKTTCPFNTKLWFYDELTKGIPYEISAKYLRYVLYYLFLSKYGAKYSKVLLTDVKDVIFQRTPFEFDFDGGLYCYLEDDDITIKESPFNAGRLIRHFGEEILEKIGDNYPSCSGTIIGSVSAIMNYLKKMLYLFSIVQTKAGGDQGLHNYLIYTNQINNLKLVHNGEGSIFTVGHKLKKAIHFNKQGFVVNEGGKVYNIVHQYDRYPELFEKCLKNYGLGVATNPLIKILYTWKNRIEDSIGYDLFSQLGWRFVNRLKWKVK